MSSVRTDRCFVLVPRLVRDRIGCFPRRKWAQPSTFLVRGTGPAKPRAYDRPRRVTASGPVIFGVRPGSRHGPTGGPSSLPPQRVPRMSLQNQEWPGEFAGVAIPRPASARPDAIPLTVRNGQEYVCTYPPSGREATPVVRAALPITWMSNCTYVRWSELQLDLSYGSTLECSNQTGVWVVRSTRRFDS